MIAVLLFVFLHHAQPFARKVGRYKGRYGHRRLVFHAYVDRCFHRASCCLVGGHRYGSMSVLSAHHRQGHQSLLASHGINALAYAFFAALGVTRHLHVYHGKQLFFIRNHCKGIAGLESFDSCRFHAFKFCDMFFFFHPFFICKYKVRLQNKNRIK